ncbi:MAG: sorbosone dehydrogenase [Ectothiorhodospiraceae bacterium]|nr:sorbosone dehydrogenase [Ectothiorhodospiraceae bacterium]
MKAGNLLAATIGMLALGAAIPGLAGTLPDCDENNAGLSLPDGFCALKIADGIGPSHHLAVADSGDVYVAIRDQDGEPGGVVAMRDTSGDGRMDEIMRFGERGGTGIAIRDGHLYFGEDRRILRIPLHGKHLGPNGEVEVIAAGFPETPPYRVIPFAFDPEDRLHVSSGASANHCGKDASTPPDQALCMPPASGGEIRQFEGETTGQQQHEALRYAAGTGHVAAMAWNPVDGQLYALRSGPDSRATRSEPPETGPAAGSPSTELLRVTEGVDFGSPYCYHDLDRNKRVLSPGFGGDGRSTGQCNERYPSPELAFPGDFIPSDLLFYTGEQFPEDYRHGAFIALHRPGYDASDSRSEHAVVFVPFDGDGRANADGAWETFATGIPGDHSSTSSTHAGHRPLGLALGQDGSLYLSDARQGTVWRVVHRRQQGAQQDGRFSPLRRITDVIGER